MKMTSTYIRDNGLLERYLLGELNESDRQAVEEILKRDISLKNELNEMELDFENIALENAVQPPGIVKNALLKTVSNIKVVEQEQKVISLEGRASSRTPFYAAASVAALLLIGSIWMYTNWQDSQKRLQTLELQSEDLKEQLATIKSELDETSAWYAVINNPAIKKYVLRGNTKSPESIAVAYV
ncbi:MAG: hypothetical protein HKO94_05845, partial [Flavobacteriaceae bacterium]|nr:hypothetical protein [Flavobacteriaceae bacterium]